jgi:hypothetical protein
MIRTLINWWKRREYEAHYAWCKVPPPNWRCSRGSIGRGGNYW